MGREDPLPLCASDAHSEICNPVTGERCCGECGLVLNDELRIQYELRQEKPWRPYASQKNMRKPRSTIPRLSKVETSLNALLKKRDASVLVKKKAFEIYRTQNKHGLLKRHSPEVVAEALIYTANRLCHVHQAQSELRKNSSEHRRRILRCCQEICAALGIELSRFQDEDYLTYLTTNMKIGGKIGRAAMQILDKARDEHLLRGTSPLGTVATAVYIATNDAGEKVTQREMARAAGVSESTIRANYRILKTVTGQPAETASAEFK
jgi:transcription initiation factor TFIIB